MDQPYITVIMPVYNAEKYVHEAIESILNQTYVDFEFLIFNDCSTDSSKQIIQSFNDPRIRLIDSAVNTGYVKHLNDGLELAKGKYIARMDADDISRPDRFQKQVDFLDGHEEVGVCGTYIEFVGTKKGVVDFPIAHRDIITHFLLHGNGMAHPSVMLRKSVLDQHDILYNRALEPAEDYDLWDRISIHAQLYNMPEVMLHYRVHDTNESVVKKDKQDLAVRSIREKIISRWIDNKAGRVLGMLSHSLTKEFIGEKDLITFSLFTSKVLNSSIFNSNTLRKVLSPIFVTNCKQANASGFKKALYYIKFPKYKFSIRTCFTLLINR